MRIPFVKLNPLAIEPVKMTRHSAGFDLCGCTEETIEVFPGEIMLIPTGLAIALPVGWEAQIRPRSGLAKRGITIANSPGTVDSDYRGAIGILIHNQSTNMFRVSHGDRIAQLVIKEVPQVVFDLVESLDDTERGTGGFGSTGVKSSPELTEIAATWGPL